MALAECNTLRTKSEAPGDGSLLQRAALALMHFLHLLLVLEEEEGVLLDSRKGLFHGGRQDSVPYKLDLSQLDDPFADRLTQPQNQRFPSGSSPISFYL